MNNTKWLVFIFLFPLTLGLYSCKQKRHDRSREYQLDHYAFFLVSAVNDREFYLELLRNTLQEKKKTILNPARTDTLKGDQQHLAAYDSLFFRSDELLDEPVKKIGSGAAADHTPPDNVTHAEAAWLEERINGLVTVFRQINQAYKRFDQYYTRRSYKEDKGLYGLELIDSIRLLENRFDTISDSIILRSDHIFKDIYEVPEKKDAFAPAATLMQQSIADCNGYILLLEQLLSGSSQSGASMDKALGAAKDSIRQRTMQLAQLGLSGTDRSIWADVLLLKFRDQLLGLSTYAEVRLPGAGQRKTVQKADLDFLKDLENRMHRYYTTFTRL
ncbi:hypothetical protein LQ567_15520 [Niabella pedocola]|uniref:DUF3829 domain-containing protein n=1 Tax=Niabella pedocola TaxID=1752077 RepID=A0ABS8PTS0_9BACT|nr:hypothetical protein [Niabella pedocola]MCD2424189.1 hypothetical protein [Niabella pedocola]